MFTAGPTRLTIRPWLRGSRSRRTLTGTGLAQPNGGAPVSRRMAGRITVPKGSTWGMGLRVRRPARLAVSSPKSRARAPWETSWRMIEGMSTASHRRVSARTTWRRTTRMRTRPTSTASTALSREDRGRLLMAVLGRLWACPPPRARGSAFGGAVDALTGRRHGLEPGLGDRLTARLADPVGARLHLVQRPLHLVQGLPEAGRQRLRLPALGGHLAGVGEVGVVVQPAPLVAKTHLSQLAAQVVPLLLQLRALTRRGGVTPGHLPPPYPPSASWRAGGPARRPASSARPRPVCRPGSWRWRRAREAPARPLCRPRDRACGWRRSGAGHGG